MANGWRRKGRRQAGYSLVVLIMAVTVLNIMLAAALPMWSEMIKRDKEEELISRGFQYAEAIRVFQKRFQRYPISLDELIKVKPRCIRQLWKDPMTEDGRWTLIFAGQGSQLTPVPGMPNPQSPNRANPNQPQAGPNPRQPQPGDGLDPNQPQVAAVGPIVGVRSRSTQKSLLLFFGHDQYDEWEFRVEMLTRGPIKGPGYAVPGAGLALSTQWLGRPFESFVPPGNGLPPSALTGSPPPRNLAAPNNPGGIHP